MKPLPEPALLIVSLTTVLSWFMAWTAVSAPFVITRSSLVAADSFLLVPFITASSIVLRALSSSFIFLISSFDSPNVAPMAFNFAANCSKELSSSCTFSLIGLEFTQLSISFLCLSSSALMSAIPTLNINVLLLPIIQRIK